MAKLMGYSDTVQYAPGTAYAQGAVAGVNAPQSVVIDGTPVRVVLLALAAAGGLAALHWAGFRFAIGVSA